MHELLLSRIGVQSNENAMRPGAWTERLREGPSGEGSSLRLNHAGVRVVKTSASGLTGDSASRSRESGQDFSKKRRRANQSSAGSYFAADFFSGVVLAWARASVFATSSQSSCHGFRSASGSLANASGPRTPAKSMIHQPVPHLLDDDRAELFRLLVKETPPFVQVGAQPVQGLAAQAAALPAVEFVGVLALTAAGQGRGTGGVVAVTGPAVVAELGVGLQTPRLEKRTAAAMQALVVTELSEGQVARSSSFGTSSSFRTDGQATLQHDLAARPSRIRLTMSRAMAEPTGADLRGPPERGQGVLQLKLG